MTEKAAEKSLRETLEEQLSAEPETPEVEATAEVEAEGESDDKRAISPSDDPDNSEPESSQDDSEKAPEVTAESAEASEEAEVMESAESEDEPTSESEDEPAFKAPQALTGDRKADWDKLDPKWQQEIVRLEVSQQKGIQKLAQTARFGEEMQKEFEPYQAMIRAQNGNPQQMVRQLLGTVYTLQTGSPQQKAQILQQVARQYGIDPRMLGKQVQIDPNTQYLTDRIQQLENNLTSQQTQEVEQQRNAVATEVQQFATDPKNVHYEQVKETMADLIEMGQANTLQEAYSKSCELEGLSVAPSPKTGKKDPVTPKEPKVADKKKAAASITGSAEKTTKKAPEGTLRDQIAAQVYEGSSRI